MEELEDYTINNCHSLNAPTAAQIVLHYGPMVKDAELVEILEKLVGNGIESLSAQEDGTSLLFEVLRSF